jgi:hypothetical protein
MLITRWLKIYQTLIETLDVSLQVEGVAIKLCFRWVTFVHKNWGRKWSFRIPNLNSFPHPRLTKVTQVSRHPMFLYSVRAPPTKGKVLGSTGNCRIVSNCTAYAKHARSRNRRPLRHPDFWQSMGCTMPQDFYYMDD